MSDVFFAVERETGIPWVAFRQYKDADDYCQYNDPERYNVKSWKVWDSYSALKKVLDQVAQLGEL